MKLKHIAHIFILFLICSGASGASLSGKYSTDTPLKTDKQKKVFSTLFDIELWSKSYPEKYDQDLTIRIIFASRFDNSDVIDFIVDESQEIHGFSKAQLNRLSNSLSKSITCDPKSGLILDLNYIPQQGVVVTCGDAENPITIPDGPLSFFLLDVFLHPNSEYKNLSQK